MFDVVNRMEDFNDYFIVPPVLAPEHAKNGKCDPLQHQGTSASAVHVDAH